MAGGLFAGLAPQFGVCEEMKPTVPQIRNEDEPDTGAGVPGVTSVV